MAILFLGLFGSCFALTAFNVYAFLYLMFKGKGFSRSANFTNWPWASLILSISPESNYHGRASLLQVYRGANLSVLLAATIPMLVLSIRGIMLRRRLGNPEFNLQDFHYARWTQAVALCITLPLTCIFIVTSLILNYVPNSWTLPMLILTQFVPEVAITAIWIRIGAYITRHERKIQSDMVESRKLLRNALLGFECNLGYLSASTAIFLHIARVGRESPDKSKIWMRVPGVVDMITRYARTPPEVRREKGFGRPELLAFAETQRPRLRLDHPPPFIIPVAHRPSERNELRASHDALDNALTFFNSVHATLNNKSSREEPPLDYDLARWLRRETPGMSLAWHSFEMSSISLGSEESEESNFALPADVEDSNQFYDSNEIQVLETFLRGVIEVVADSICLVSRPFDSTFKLPKWQIHAEGTTKLFVKLMSERGYTEAAALDLAGVWLMPILKERGRGIVQRPDMYSKEPVWEGRIP
ncbi:hypothetical protein B0H67DRAFT_670091 [Lasiosphaeris hirsuta]|uniref:Uncharacterized protein n=1 Tax=Lasiosphaeris hirsuta TaxID=260670 RepID=A0AA40A1C9_9PEZI|nr:hypothetical protein B0H67DRAFT_670091 [Lasiosphaeris hirsuta]